MMIITMTKIAAVCTVVDGTTARRGSVAGETTWILATTHVIVTTTGTMTVGLAAGVQRESSVQIGPIEETAAEVALWTESAARIGPATIAQTEGTAVSVH